MKYVHQKGRPPGPSAILKLHGRWGGWIHPKKLKVIGRRMLRRIARLYVKDSDHGAQ